MLFSARSDAQANTESTAQSSAKSRERAQRAVEQGLDAARWPGHRGGGPWTALISLVALILSGLSLYETVLKQAHPALHVGAVMYYARDLEGVEVFAVPVTVTNHGARDTVVTALDLRVSAPGAATASFTSAYLGAGADPTKDKRPFTPLSISGRGSYAGIVLFHPANLKGRTAPVVTGGAATYRFCIGARTESGADYPGLDDWLGAAPPATAFEAEVPWFAARALDASRAIPLQIRNARRHEAPRGKDGSSTLACD